MRVAGAMSSEANQLVYRSSSSDIASDHLADWFTPRRRPKDRPPFSMASHFGSNKLDQFGAVDGLFRRRTRIGRKIVTVPFCVAASRPMTKDPSKIKRCPECKSLVEALTMRPLSRTPTGAVRYVCTACFTRIMALRKKVRETSAM